MTENQLNFLMDNHKKQVAIVCGMTDQAVFKWSRVGKIPAWHKAVLDALSVDEFCSRIAKYEQQMAQTRIDAIRVGLNYIK